MNAVPVLLMGIAVGFVVGCYYVDWLWRRAVRTEEGHAYEKWMGDRLLHPEDL